MITGISVRGRDLASNHSRLSFFSPAILLGLLALVFTFFVTASGRSGYNLPEAKSRAVIRTEMPGQNGSSALIYEKVVRNADAIRSVLQ